MDRLHQLVRAGGDDRGRQDGCIGHRIVPLVIDPSKRKEVRVRRGDPVRHLVIAYLHPFIEAVTWDQTPPGLKGGLEGRLLGYRFCPGVDWLELGVFGPVGDQTKMSVLVVAVVEEGSQGLRWSDVIAGDQLTNEVVVLTIVSQDSFTPTNIIIESYSSTHEDSIACPRAHEGML